MKKTVIFDLDGTLALIDKRRVLSARPDGKINWQIFFDPKNIELDEPNWPVIEMFKAMKSLGHRVIIFSGRDSINKEATQAWLDKYGIQPDILRMRPQGSFTPDDKLKKDWLYQLPEVGIALEDILCIFDDRDKVVKMWRENGISCFQVAEGSF
jgi:phosphoglycolate phosphatase-like HAD superfamily hydrolase